MELVNCKNCDAPFIKKLTEEICFNCLKQEIDCVKKIKEFAATAKIGYLSLQSISEHTGIELILIEKIYKKGLLLGIVDKLEVKCKFCGLELRGKDNKIDVCPDCSKKMCTKINIEKALIIKEEPVDKDRKAKKLAPSRRETKQDDVHKYGFKKRYD